jgi:hypothetical protein
MIPPAFESFCPIGQVMNFIQEKDRCSAMRALFSVAPTTLPKARKCRIRLITRGVDSSIPKLGGNLEEQSGLANLARAREELNSAWRWLAEPF